MSSSSPRCPEHLRKDLLDEPISVGLSAGDRLYKFVSLPIDRLRILQSPW
jgi:hypothetical protein